MQKEVVETLKKKSDEYHDLHLKNDTLPSSDAFENFREMCQKSYGLDPAKLLAAPGLAWQAALKKLK